MARRRFFVEEVRGGKALIAGEDAKHLTRVLRVERGQHYEIADNRGVYLAEIVTAHKELVEFRVVESIPLRPEAARIVLMPALIKFDHLEWMIEKATELGVDVIAPFVATRSERGLDKAAVKRVERWRRIAEEASQQSRRDRVPAVEDAVEFGEAARRTADYRFMLDEEPGTGELLAAAPAEPKASDVIAVAVGPEGGWTDGERERFRSLGWQPVALGPNVLRAETAAMTAAALIGAAWRSGLKR